MLRQNTLESSAKAETNARAVTRQECAIRIGRAIVAAGVGQQERGAWSMVVANAYPEDASAKCLEAALFEQAADVRVSLGLPCIATFADVARVVVAECGKADVDVVARLRNELAEKDRRIAALEAALEERWAAE